MSLATRLERVLLLEEHGLLTDEEHRRISNRGRTRPQALARPCRYDAREAADRIERSTRAREDEAIAIAEALEAGFRN